MLMKTKRGFLLAAMAMVGSACEAASASYAAEATAPKTSEVKLTAGAVTVYDYGDIKLHVQLTGDVMADVAYIVEGRDALVAIELPCFTKDLEAWKAYINGLGKPMNDIFICDHPAGASYISGMKVYGTQGAKDSIAGGSTKAITQGLYKSFGKDFHGGSDTAQIDTVVAGKVTVGGVDFELLDHGETYDIVIPALNAIYTHMLGKTTHSIMTSVAHIDATIAVLKSYQEAGYATILTSHGGPEGQDAVAEKIAYLTKTKELAAASDNAGEFTAAMQKAFPNYGGENYLNMTAGALFPAK